MSFNQPVRPNFSFRGFRQRGKENKDGWGIAFYPDRAAQIFKEPKRAHESPLSEFISDYPDKNANCLLLMSDLGVSVKLHI
jgi:glutamine amidotransferase